MQKLSLAIAVTSLLMAAGCAQQKTTMQQEGAEHIVISNDPAPAGAELLDTITAVDGGGCRGFSHVGIRPLVEIELRNQALALGGDYVQIVQSRAAGGETNHCLDSGYQLQGQVYRVPGTRSMAQRLAEEGPLVLAPQDKRPEEPGFQPRAVKPREMRSHDDRERMLPGEENWPRRESARYVSVYTDEGQRIVRGLQEGTISRKPVRVIPASELPKRVEMPARSARAVTPPVEQPMAAAPVVKPSVAAEAPRVIQPPVAVSAPAPVAAAPAVERAAVPAPVVAPAPVTAPAVAAPTPAPVPVVKPVVSMPPAPSPVTSIEPPSMATASPMPRPASSAAPMPVPDMPADVAPEGVRQVTLSPKTAVPSAPAGGNLSREERDRKLEELARDSSLSYDEYQRRYREIMAQ